MMAPLPDDEGQSQALTQQGADFMVEPCQLRRCLAAFAYLEIDPPMNPMVAKANVASGSLHRAIHEAMRNRCVQG
jgi:hypothetical protein